MKKIGLIIAIVGCVTAGNYAVGQDTPPPPPPTKENRVKLSPDEKVEKQTNKMKEELGLSDEQAAKVKVLNMNHIQEMEALRVQIKALKDQAKVLHEEHDAEISSVLTAEQQKIHEEKVAERKAKKEERRKEGRPVH